MTWLLVVFLPGHVRGQITMGPRDAGGDRVESCCAPPPPPSCCGKSSGGQPTQKDRDNCAVCFFAAGLITTPAFILDLTHSERTFERARVYHEQVRRVALRLNHHGRDPPVLANV